VPPPAPPQPSSTGPTGQVVGIVTVPGGAAGTPITEYVIKQGDSLYSISEGVLGGRWRYTEILKANPDIDFTKLRVGQVIKLPTSQPANADR